MQLIPLTEIPLPSPGLARLRPQPKMIATKNAKNTQRGVLSLLSTPHSLADTLSKSGVALRFPPQSKRLWLRLCRAALKEMIWSRGTAEYAEYAEKVSRNKFLLRISRVPVPSLCPVRSFAVKTRALEGRGLWFF